MRIALILVTCALIAASFPHALEDFQYEDLARFGIAAPASHIVLLIAYAFQVVGIILTVRGSTRGVPILGIMGAVWSLGAVFVHGHDLLLAGPTYRHGWISRLLEALIIVLGMLAAALAVRLRVSKRM
jgi:hypothetical protein